MFDYFTLSADVLYILGGILLGIIRASGVTVESGTTGLLFTLGRIDRPVPLLLRPLVPLVRTLPWLSGVPRTLLEPGFHPMIPFLQRARRVPTRSRTLDLPAQKVATFEGYVFVADANVVYRIVDVRRALIMVDDVVEGLKQMLTLGVQDVLRAASARELQSGEGLDEALRENLERKVVIWGVEIERAGFPTITPSPRTLRITQLEQRANERHRRMLQLVGGERGDAGLSVRSALGTVGTRRVFRTKARARRADAARHRRRLALEARLQKRAWTGAAIDRVLRRLS
ncbi:MAG: SPFH domain-containing protein [Planctomycetota bacterium]